MADSPVFHVLGPLEVTVAGRTVAVPAGKQRILLSVLLLNAGQTVSLDELIRHLWNAGPPARPRSAVHTVLTRLRNTLGAAGADPARLIHTSVAGYRIEVGADQLDLLRLRELRSAARQSAEAGDRLAEAALLGEALALWRGPVLPEVGSEPLHRDTIPSLTEELLDAANRYHAVRIALGRHGELAGELRALISRYPYHERLWHDLMVVLHATGRRAEAVRAFAEVTSYLCAELDIGPSPELRALHDAIRDSG